MRSRRRNETQVCWVKDETEQKRIEQKRWQYNLIGIAIILIIFLLHLLKK